MNFFCALPEVCKLHCLPFYWMQCTAFSFAVHCLGWAVHCLFYCALTRMDNALPYLFQVHCLRWAVHFGPGNALPQWAVHCLLFCDALPQMGYLHCRGWVHCLLLLRCTASNAAVHCLFPVHFMNGRRAEGAVLGRSPLHA